jgi:bacteriorhodopsin
MTPVTKTGLNPYVACARPAIEAGRYTLTAQALHWLTVFLILMILPVAWVMMSLPEGAEQTRMLVLHRSLGVTIFAVSASVGMALGPSSAAFTERHTKSHGIDQPNYPLAALCSFASHAGHRLPPVGGW